jgi:hypothetical protein
MKRAASGVKKSRSSATSSSARGRAPARRGKRYVICVSSGRYPASLEVGKVYRNLGAPEPGPAHHLRVVDESGEDYVYPKALFRAIELPVPIQRALAHAVSAA